MNTRRPKIDTCVRDNVAALRQGAELLAGLSPDDYVRRAPDCFNSSAGGHMRHVVEHYLSFFSGLDSTQIDYEARARDPLIESDPAYAAAQLDAIASRLALLSDDRALSVRAECPSAGGQTVWAESSVMRELEFLLSHTVHHYALVHVVCRAAGKSTPEGFGMAPSTLRHLQREAAVASCAR